MVAYLFGLLAYAASFVTYRIVPGLWPWEVARDVATMDYRLIVALAAAAWCGAGCPGAAKNWAGCTWPWGRAQAVGGGGGGGCSSCGGVRRLAPRATVHAAEGQERF